MMCWDLMIAKLSACYHVLVIDNSAGTEKITKNLSKRNRGPGWDSNGIPPELRSKILLLDQLIHSACCRQVYHDCGTHGFRITSLKLFPEYVYPQVYKHARVFKFI
jgi:hypothetical protein